MTSLSSDSWQQNYSLACKEWLYIVQPSCYVYVLSLALLVHSGPRRMCACTEQIAKKQSNITYFLLFQTNYLDWLYIIYFKYYVVSNFHLFTFNLICLKLLYYIRLLTIFITYASPLPVTFLTVKVNLHSMLLPYVQLQIACHLF